MEDPHRSFIPFRSMAMPDEMNSDHKWLMESLSGMDLSEFPVCCMDAGLPLSSACCCISQPFSCESAFFLAQPEGDLDLAPSSGASVRFDDVAEDGLASDADSTESRFGSRENLLDPGPILSRHSSSNGRRVYP